MKVGDMVKAGDPSSAAGIVVKVDKDFYGATSAFKSNPVPRGHAVHNRRKPDYISSTKRGIRDRVMVWWPEYGFSYEESDALEVIVEIG
tara:strand:- start:588 stop:854 length:267 start_codon:yes stop_codon:yes gene_type:complete